MKRKNPALLALLLSACVSHAHIPVAAIPASVGQAVAETRKPVTIMVSIDGLGANRLGQGLTPRLDALAAAGVSGSMRPSFPATTFANHVTLVTGLRPDHHGIVDQRMRDPAKPGVTFRNTDPLTNRDPFWWHGIDPIWLVAERAGIRSGAMYWVASDVEIDGKRPSLWWPFDNAITSAQRTDTVLDWLRRPTERPGLVLLYFNDVDRLSHSVGYGSPQELSAIRDIDAQVGRLVDGLAEMGQPANLLVVSDHGMAAVPVEHIHPLSDLVDPALMEAISEGPLIDIFPKPGHEAETAARLERPPEHFTCWSKDKLPVRFKFGTHPRVPPFLCMADVGWSWPENPKHFTKGEHGYDPDTPEVAAVFIATGPAFRTPARLGKFDNVAVTPLLRDLLGLPADPSLDGDDRPFRKVLLQPHQ